MNNPICLTLCPLLVALAACGDAGTAPSISNLSITPGEITVGKANTLTGALTVEDPDGDASEVEIEIALPGGQSQKLPATPLQGAAGQKAAAIQFALALQPPTAGQYVVSIRCNDEAGNASNTLTANLEAK